MPLSVRWDLGKDVAREVAAALNALLADTFALLVKTKGVRWHAVGPHFPGHRQLFREMEEQTENTIEGIAERVRRIGETTLHSIGQISQLRRLLDHREASASAPAMLDELLNDNLQLAAFLRQAHGLCEGYGDVATAGYLEKWIDETEGRIRYLFAIRHPEEGFGPTTS